jgi:hypothetical protein
MTWQDVTVQELIEIAELEDLTPTEYKLDRISIVTGDYYDELDEDELDELLKEYAWLDEPIKGDEHHIRFNRLSWGALIDINKFVANKTPLHNYEKIIAVTIGYEDFTSKCNLIKQEPCAKYYGILEDVLKYRDKLLENFDDLLEDGSSSVEDDEAPEEPTKQEVVQSRWAWERLTYDLADGDITKVQDIMKLPHLMVLNWLTMIKDLKLNQLK